MRRRFIGIAAAVVVPPLLALALYQGELLTRYHGTVVNTDFMFDDRTKMIVQTQGDLAKLFIGFATSAIGGLAYYVRNRRSDFETFPPVAFVCLVLSMASFILSIYFGQMWVSNAINQLVRQTFLVANPAAQFEVGFPQNAQYFSFLLGLSWAVVVVVVQERQRSISENRRAS